MACLYVLDISWDPKGLYSIDLTAHVDIVMMFYHKMCDEGI